MHLCCNLISGQARTILTSDLESAHSIYYKAHALLPVQNLSLLSVMSKERHCITAKLYNSEHQPSVDFM